MFRSIRWRLVASYVLITLLTVSLVGVLTLSLVRRYVRQQETAYLTANAQAIARRAVPLMQPMVQRADLLELAHTSSFFVNARVRILDDRRQILADSGPGSNVDEFVWIAPATRFRVELEAPLSRSGPVIVALPSGDPLVIPSRPGDQYAVLKGLPSDAEVTVVHRIGGPWGSRIIFSTMPSDELSTPPTDGAGDVKDLPGKEEPPRSPQVIVTPIGHPADPVGYVELSSGLDFGGETLATTSRALFFAAGGATLLAAIIGLVVGRGLTAPLRSLTSAASQMNGSDLSARVPVHGQDEIGQLAGQFNQMAGRLETSFAELAAERDALRRFIADASHELRTPITALKTFNELLQSGAADEPSARAEFLAESQVQINRLEWITHNLLDLSRLDAGLIHLEVAGHAVAELIETATAAFKNLAQEKGVALAIHQPLPQLRLCCDRARIESALCNLLDNAIKFTPAGGHVEIGAEQAGKSVRLWVRDDGPGISPSDRPHIFERFYRGHAGGADGSGLGLAIVQSVVQAHGGQVSVESQPGEGSRFLIELPLDESKCPMRAGTISPL
jgi:signal transduction histidine kinase